MVESLLFYAWLGLISLVIVWAARNDRKEREDPLSRLFAMTRPGRDQERKPGVRNRHQHRRS